MSCDEIKSIHCTNIQPDSNTKSKKKNKKYIRSFNSVFPGIKIHDKEESLLIFPITKRFLLLQNSARTDQTNVF